MENFELLKEKFPHIILDNEKIIVEHEIFEVFNTLKNSPEFDYDLLFTIIGVDYSNHIELIYLLNSSELGESTKISIKTQNSTPSIAEIYPSANFDECEIYDLLGVEFLGNNALKRLFMPETWIGHPLKKNYELTDERLAWNG